MFKTKEGQQNPSFFWLFFRVLTALIRNPATRVEKFCAQDLSEYKLSHEKSNCKEIQIRNRPCFTSNGAIIPSFWKFVLITCSLVTQKSSAKIKVMDYLVRLVLNVIIVSLFI